MEKEDYVITSLTVGVLIVAGLAITWAIQDSISVSKLNTQYRTGEISVKQYCEEITKNGTESDIPIICYEYFKVERVGTKKVCEYNVATKTILCHDEPVLEAK